MISVDTNVLVRLLTRDEETQAEKAQKLFRDESIFVTKTVMLETEWVLRFAYQINADEIVTAFEKLLGLDNVMVEEGIQVAQAITLFNNGMDFADALHLTGSCNHPFATFDKNLQKRAQRAGMNISRLL